MTKKNQLLQDIPVRGFASVAEASAFLSCTRQHTTRLIRDGLIPARRFGRCWRVPWRWLLEQEQYTAA